MLNCRLAEALLHDGRHDDAVECVRRALPTAVDDVPLLHICAWVLSNSDCHDEAAAAYARLIELRPDWIEGYRHASGSLAASGRIDAAIAYAVTASNLAPGHAEFALHAASLLVDRQRNEEGAALALRAAELRPDDANTVIDAAELLIRCGRAEKAAEILGAAVTAASTSNPRLYRALSTAEMLRDRLEAALVAVERALADAPDDAEYQLHRAHLLWRLGDISGAALAFERVATLDPVSRDVKRAQMSFYLAAGLATEATEAGGELLHRFPDDRPSAEAVLHLLNHRLDTIDGEYVVLGDTADRKPRPPHAEAGALDRWCSQSRVIRALIVRETRTRFADSRLGYGWALIEPILHIALLSATFAVLMHGKPPIGTQFFIFYYTGLIRYYVACATTK
jgi:tetratricopeptide (TPR) repeat protein